MRNLQTPLVSALRSSLAAAAVFLFFGCSAWPVSAATLAAGDLVKLPDDGNPETTADSAVYYYGTDGKRYVFPNAQTYFTWYADFNGVKTVSAAELAALPIGGNITYRPGTRLVKITSDPNVYAVEPGGKLRWVQTEAVAKSLYGDLWNQRIDDIPDAFFFNYTISEALAAAVYPDGTVVKRSSDNVYFRIENRNKRKIAAADVRNALRIQDKYVIVTSSSLNEYPDASDIATAELGITDTAQKNLTAIASVPTFSVRLPATNFISVGGDASLLELRLSSVKAVTVRKLTVKLEATTGSAPAAGEVDTDKGGLVYENNARANLTTLRFNDALGAEPFGRKELTVSVDQDQSQTLVWSGSYQVAAGTEAVLYLRAQVNEWLPNGEGYKATLVVGGVEVADAATTVPVVFAPAADLAGPALSTLNSSLQVLASAVPGSKTYVRGAKAAEIAGFTLKATVSAPNVVNSLAVQGYIDEDNKNDFLPGVDNDNGSATTVREMLPSVSLYDDKGNKLGGPASVDVDGKAVFTGLAISIPAGQQTNVIIKGDLSPLVDIETAPNKLTFDVTDAANDVQVVDDRGTKVNATGRNPNGGVEATYYASVRKEGTVKFSWQGNSGGTIAGREVLLGTLNIETKYDSYQLANLSFRQPESQAASLGAVRLEYPTGASTTASQTKDFSGSLVMFTGLPVTLGQDATATLKLYGTVKSRAGGAVYEESIKVRFGNSDALQFTSAADSQIFDEGDITATGDFTAPTNTVSSLTVRYSGLTAAKTTANNPSQIYHDVQTVVLGFSLQAAPEGQVKVKKMTFKLSPSDVGKTGADNDALELWAKVNGDFSDDDNVVNLKQVLASGNTVIGEDSSTRIIYSVVRGGVRNGSPVASNFVSATGDYGVIEYVFNDGSEFTIAAGTTAQFLLELDTAAFASDKDYNLSVDLLSGGDFAWTDSISGGLYTALGGGNASGLSLANSMTVKY